MRQVTKPENRVLLAGLRPLEAESASAALGSEGVRVDCVRDADEVIAAVAEGRPGGIVLDDGLPGISGSALCKILRRRAETRHTPILLLVSASSEEAIQRAVDAGASDLLRRPLHGRLLARRIGTWVRLRQRESELARSRDLLRRLAGVATWEVGASGGPFEVSSGLHELLGADPLGPNSLDALLVRCPEEERERLRGHFQTALETGASFSDECRLELPGGEERFVSWEAEVLTDDRGKVALISGASRTSPSGSRRPNRCDTWPTTTGSPGWPIATRSSNGSVEHSSSPDAAIAASPCCSSIWTTSNA